MRSTTKVLLSAALAASLASACERHVSEPDARSASPSAVDSAPVAGSVAFAVSASSTAEAPTAGGQPPRCIKQTPPQPSRPDPPPGFAPNCPDDPGRPKLERAKVRFPSADTELDVELAITHQQRMRGLMYRKSMAQGEGMLFVFGQRRVHRFWMKNTCIALDMMFIDRDGLIVGIEENVPTMNETSYHVGCPSLYVLEANAGWARRHGVKAGQLVELPAAAAGKER
jgi:uncharacterized membrane protein (UPF0127 family)